MPHMCVDMARPNNFLNKKYKSVKIFSKFCKIEVHFKKNETNSTKFLKFVKKMQKKIQGITCNFKKRKIFNIFQRCKKN